MIPKNAHNKVDQADRNISRFVQHIKCILITIFCRNRVKKERKAASNALWAMIRYGREWKRSQGAIESLWITQFNKSHNRMRYVWAIRLSYAAAGAICWRKYSRIYAHEISDGHKFGPILCVRKLCACALCNHNRSLAFAPCWSVQCVCVCVRLWRVCVRCELCKLMQCISIHPWHSRGRTWYIHIIPADCTRPASLRHHASYKVSHSLYVFPYTQFASIHLVCWCEAGQTRDTHYPAATAYTKKNCRTPTLCSILRQFI